MFQPGDNVQFRRSNGNWSSGQVREMHRNIVVVQWLSKNGQKLGRKCVEQRFVKKAKAKHLGSLMIFFGLLILIAFGVDCYLNMKAELEIESKIYEKEECGWSYLDLLYSRTQRCIELEKKKTHI